MEFKQKENQCRYIQTDMGDPQYKMFVQMWPCTNDREDDHLFCDKHNDKPVLRVQLNDFFIELMKNFKKARGFGFDQNGVNLCTFYQSTVKSMFNERENLNIDFGGGQIKITK